MAPRGRGGCGGTRRGARAVSAMETFVVTFRFASPPILRGALTLDAVLGGELARDGGSLEEAIRATPLARTDGVHHGSALLLGDTCVTRPVRVIQNLWAELTTADPAAIAFGRRRVAPGSVKSVLNESEARVCAGGAWLGTGYLDEVESILSPILGIGKRRRAGCGMIAPDSLEVEPVEADPATFGLVSRPGDPDFATARVTPRRPLPLDLFVRLGGDPLDEVVAMVRVRQPYYDPANAPEPAVVPPP